MLWDLLETRILCVTRLNIQIGLQVINEDLVKLALYGLVLMIGKKFIIINNKWICSTLYEQGGFHIIQIEYTPEALLNQWSVVMGNIQHAYTAINSQR